MDGIVQIFFGSLLLSLVHATIPSHWLPLIAIGKSERWSEKETVWVTAVTAISHTISTVVIGILVGMIGYQLSESYHIFTKYFAPAILILLGLVYFFLEYRHSKIKTAHQHHHIDVEKIAKRKSKRSIVFTLSVAMFFSPCLEIEIYYFTASRLGWLGITVVSVVYFFITIIGMVLLVYFGSKGIKKLQWHFLEHHDKLISGVILVLVGLLAFFVEF
ncbi:MAG: sulfite exporter TauE/SafE family protein [Melioribacteraceae bacterium]